MPAASASVTFCHKLRSCPAIAAVVLSVAWFTSTALAADIQWNGGSNAIWQNVNNWDPFGSPFAIHRVPGDVDTATLSTPAGDTVILDGDTTPINGLLVTNGITILTSGYLLQVDDAGSATAAIAGNSTTISVAPRIGGGIAFRTDGLFISGDGRLSVDGGDVQIDGITTLLSQGQIFSVAGGAIHFGGDVFVADSDITAGPASFSPGITLTAQSDALVRLIQSVNVVDGVTFDFDTGAELETLSLNIGNDGQGLGSVGSVGLDSGSVLTVSSNLTIGHPTTGSGLLDISDAGAEVTGTTTVHATGTIELGGIGQFIAHAPVLVDGGTITTTGGGAPLLVDPGVDLTAINDGDVTVQGNQSILADSTFEFNSGADLSVAFSLRVGGGVGGPGTLIVDGVGSTLDVANVLTIGDAQSGAVMLLNGATGEATSITVGSSGTGELTIAGGAALTTISTSRIGVVSGVSGTATVTGAGSNWISDQLQVGSDSEGTLITANGASVVTPSLVLGVTFGSSGTVTVTDAGSTVESGVLFAGYYGTGSLTIQDGGSATGDSSFIGLNANSNGSATVTGANSTWTMTGQLSIGGDASLGQNGGAGSLDILPGGTVSVAQDTVLFPDGVLRLHGGTLASSEIRFEGGGLFDWEGGTLHVEVFDGDLLNEGGTLAPGLSAGSTVVLGNYTQQAGAALEIEIGGTTPGGNHDLVGVTGFVLLGVDSELQIRLIDGFTPAPSDTFTVLNATNIFGVFTNVLTGQRLDTLDGVGSFLVHYGAGSASNPNQIVLTDFVLVGLPGDYNNDGTVDAADYVAWRKNEGAPPGTLPNDIDGGVIGQAQYDTWRANFGNTLGSGSSSGAAVPEPASFILFLLSMLATLAGGRMAASSTRLLATRVANVLVWLTAC